MDLALWFAYFLAVVGISVLPGSGAFLCTNYSLSEGFKASRYVILGMEVATFILIFISALGVGKVLQDMPFLFLAFKIIGGCYLIYLGIVKAYHTKNNYHNNLETEGISETVLRRSSSKKKLFWTGFFVDMTNPKSIIFFIAITPSFISIKYALLPQVWIISLTMVIVDAVIMLGYAYLAGRLAVFLKQKEHQLRFNYMVAAIFVLLGISIIFF